MQLLRKQKKVLKAALRSHDPAAARQLLAHSVALGHERLAVNRYLAARYLGADGLEPFKAYCRDAARRFKPDALLTSAAKLRRELRLTCDEHHALSDLVRPAAPLVLSYAGTPPMLGDGPRYCGTQVSLAGRIAIGADPWFGSRAAVRGDGHVVRIGDDFRIGSGSTVHISHDLYPVMIGNRVTAGDNVVLHACTVDDDCVIEQGTIVLDGSLIESGVLVEAESTIFPRSVLKSGWVYSGSPAVAVRKLEEGELEVRRAAVSEAIFTSIWGSDTPPRPQKVQFGAQVFIAETATLRGKIRLGSVSGIFFGCVLDGGNAAIEIGSDCNIQDNAVMDAAEGAIALADRVTIGHNVQMKSCSVGSDTLIGIGSRLAPGTIVEENVLLAAGSITERGQRLERGWLWGGRPARKLMRLDDRKRRMLAATIEHYRTYGRIFAAAQQNC